MNENQKITWQPNYSVGNPVLDEQHKQLLRICNQAIECMDSDTPESRAAFHLILNDLFNYTENHFRTEEGLLEKFNYPLLDEHKAEHLAYQEKLTDFLLEATQGKINQAALLNYLSAWWREHILCSDKQYKQTLNS